MTPSAKQRQESITGSQVVVDNGTRALIRNYDYHPELFEQVVMSTRFTDRDVIGATDSLWTA